jgi:hypothetical protein
MIPSTADRARALVETRREEPVDVQVLERWNFDIQTEGDGVADPSKEFDKPEKEIMGEIQAIIRQITASVTFLPLLQDACTFDLLVYTDANVEVPQSWEESDPKYINNQQEVIPMPYFQETGRHNCPCQSYPALTMPESRFGCGPSVLWCTRLMLWLRTRRTIFERQSAANSAMQVIVVC